MAAPSLPSDYQCVIPEIGADGHWRCGLSAKAPKAGRARLDPFDADRLAGWSPTLTVTDAGVTPDPGPDRPLLARHAFTLRAAADDPDAQVRSATFHLESTVVQRLRAGDLLHMVYDEAIAVAAFRENRLLLAVGALFQLPLGDDLDLRVPWDLRREVLEVYRRHDPTITAHSPTAAGLPCPLAFRHGGETAVMLRGTRRLGPYEITIVRGLDVEDDDAPPAIAAVCRVGEMSRLGARLSAELLATPDALVCEP